MQNKVVVFDDGHSGFNNKNNTERKEKKRNFLRDGNKIEPSDPLD